MHAPTRFFILSCLALCICFILQACSAPKKVRLVARVGTLAIDGDIGAHSKGSGVGGKVSVGKLGLDDDDDVTMTVSQHCLTCHVGELPNPELHAKHMESDVECHKCHMPQVSSDPRKYSIHDHKFFFGQPESLTPLPVEKTCETCHDDANSGSSG